MGRRSDRRFAAIATVIVLVVAGGAALQRLPGGFEPGWTPRAEPHADPVGHVAAARRTEVRVRFDQGVAMLHARQYEHAVVALHRVLELDPALPEAHVNLGYALIGLERYGAARDFFEGATALRPAQANAYYGLAVALEALGDVAGALGAMRTFVHLAPGDDPFRRRARAAIWEWEARLAPAAAQPAAFPEPGISSANEKAAAAEAAGPAAGTVP
ncbi:MAG TPA: tetratricopeptide repeat protein [Pelomicrobium sp.]|nr:tetratricopeptide repeat protein [Pelomicrobium sp.]